MKLFFLILFSLISESVFSASCCVSNTSISNLMILPAKWQQTLSMAQTRAIGDTDTSGSSTFRSKNNKEQTTSARMDLAYGWTPLYQSGVSLRYQNKNRDFNGTSANDSGWSDVGLSHAYQLKNLHRAWIFQTLNIPTARSIYDSQDSYAVDAQGSGTYQTAVGIFYVKNYKEWDFFVSPEVHYAFGKTFKNQNEKIQLEDSKGGSLTVGIGHIPWRSKFRLGMNLTPRLEGAKTVKSSGRTDNGSESLVWDTTANLTYTIDAQYSIGLNYIDQTLVGPARNTVLNRTGSFIFQTRW